MKKISKLNFKKSYYVKKNNKKVICNIKLFNITKRSLKI